MDIIGGKQILMEGNDVDSNAVVTSTSHNNNNTSNSSSLSYALRRVFSTDAQRPTEFQNEEEAQELIPHRRERPAAVAAPLSHRVSSHVLERNEVGEDGEEEEGAGGAELILDVNTIHTNNDKNKDDDDLLIQNNVSVANAMLEEHKQKLKKGGGYQLRKFLSTPHYNNNNNNNNTSSTASSLMNNGPKGLGGAHAGVSFAQSLSSSTAKALRRTPSYDPNASFYDEDEFHDNYIMVSSSSNRHNSNTKKTSGEKEEEESPLFRSTDDNVEVSLADHTSKKLFGGSSSSSSRPRSQLSNDEDVGVVLRHSLEDPIPFNRNPLSFRRKTSDLLKNSSSSPSSFRKEDVQDDLSTVAESIEFSPYDHDLKKGTSQKIKYHFSLRRSIILSAIVLVVCFIGGTVFTVLGKSGSNDVVEEEEETVASNHLEVVGSNGTGNNQYGSNNEEYTMDNTDFALIVDDGEVGGSIYNDKPTSNNNGNQNGIQNGIYNVNSSSSNSSSSSSSNNNNVGAPSSSIVSVLSENTEITASNFPTDSPTSATYTKFYIMADCPYDDNERNNLMPGYIEDLSSDAAFLFHLGDMEYAKVDHCEEWAYETASSILKKSPIPTFVLPGDNDMNDCPDHEHGEDMWKQYFHKIDEYWEHDFAVTRWGKFDESFSFVHKGVLYFGLNVVGGDPYSESEAEIRYALHLENVRSILNDMKEKEYKVIVLLAHADPAYGGSHEELFEELAEIFEKVGKPTIHFNGDYHEYYEKEGGDYDVENYVRITLDGESIAPPLRVEIDVSKKNPITVSRRRDDLSVDCCSDGWPRIDEE
jgi:hypothetical protein